jgi:hypothetical protein
MLQPFPEQIDKICKGNKPRLTLAEMSMIASCLDASLYSLLAPTESGASARSGIRALEVVEKR